jgi:hypothetical protein
MADRDKQEYSKKNLSFSLFYYHNFHTDRPGIEHDHPP